MATIRNTAPKSRWLAPLYGAIALAIAATAILVVSYVMHKRAVPGKVAQYLAAGDRYRTEMWYDRALKEYEAALQLDPRNVPAQRRIVATLAANLTLKGFGPGAPVDPALRADYDRIQLVPPAEVDAALSRVHALYAAVPESVNDPELLWDEAMLLKVAGKSEQARAVLERLHRFQPNDVAASAELGLLTAILAVRYQQPATLGFNLIEGAVAAAPREPRYHLYLARMLQEVYGCNGGALKVAYIDRRVACARARQEYVQAETLAQGDDLWMRRIRLRAEKDANQPSLH